MAATGQFQVAAATRKLRLCTRLRGFRSQRSVVQMSLFLETWQLLFNMYMASQMKHVYRLEGTHIAILLCPNYNRQLSTITGVKVVYHPGLGTYI